MFSLIHFGGHTNMIRLLVLLLFATSVQAGVLDDLESVRASVTRRLHIEEIGTAQYTAAEIDSNINEAVYYHATKVRLVPAPYVKVDSIAITKGQTIYQLNSDFVHGGLRYCLNHHPTISGGTNEFVPVIAIGDLATPLEGATPNQVFSEGGVLGVHPIPQGDHDTLIIWYQALPTPMAADTGSVMIIQKYREMMVLYVCWQIATTLGTDMDAAKFERLYDKERGIVTGVVE